MIKKQIYCLQTEYFIKRKICIQYLMHCLMWFFSSIIFFNRHWNFHFILSNQCFDYSQFFHAPRICRSWFRENHLYAFIMRYYDHCRASRQQISTWRKGQTARDLSTCTRPRSRVSQLTCHVTFKRKKSRRCLDQTSYTPIHDPGRCRLQH